MSLIISHEIPPHAEEIERCVLGALIIENAKDYNEIKEIISAESFYCSANQIIYKAIEALFQKSPIDIFTLTDYLAKTGKLDEIGGPIYITQLSGVVASSAHILEHAQIVRECELLRLGIEKAREIIQTAYSRDLDNTITKINHFNDLINNEIIKNKKEGKRIPDLLRFAMDEYEKRERLAKAGKVPGIPTPSRNLTRMIGGWQKQELVIIAGRPGMGKTAFVLAALRSAAESGNKVAMFSLEMSGVKLMDRLICSEAGINATAWKEGRATKEEMEAAEKAINRLFNYQAYIDDSALVNWQYIHNRSRQLKQRNELDLIIIDYLQLIETEKDKNKIREQLVAEISRKAKLTAKELDVPVILLCQLSRETERRPDKRPSLADLRESGSIEQDADLVLMLYRPEYYGIEHDFTGDSTAGKGELIIAKHRNGQTGNVFISYNESLTQITDWQKPYHPIKKETKNYYENDEKTPF